MPQRLEELRHWVTYIRTQGYTDHAKIMDELLAEIDRLQAEASYRGTYR